MGADADQLEPWRTERGVVDHSNQIVDFLDTACLISQFDLVISVDTAVAHLAGALDVPVWTLLQHNADFRWMRGRSDSLGIAPRLCCANPSLESGVVCLTRFSNN